MRLDTRVAHFGRRDSDVREGHGRRPLSLVMRPVMLRKMHFKLNAPGVNVFPNYNVRTLRSR